MANKRRLYLFLVLALLLAAIGLASCDSAEIEVEESSVVIVVPEDPPSFNAMISDTGYDALVMELVLLGLTDLDANGNIITELAESLPSLENGDQPGNRGMDPWPGLY